MAYLDSGEKIGTDLCPDCGKGVPSYEAQISEKNSHEDWAPDELIKRNLFRNCERPHALDLGVKPVVEVMS